MNLRTQHLLKLHRLYAPAGDFGSDTGGTETIDRGDNFTPTDDEPTKPEPAAKDGLDEDKDVDPDNPDDEEEEKAEKAEKDEGKSKKKDNRIPLSRHTELLEKERAKRQELERQLASFQQGNQVATLNEDITKTEEKIIDLEKKHATLMADGETDKAAALMSQIRGLERQVIEAKSDMKIAAAEARATERARYNIALERIEQAYPVLNEDSDEFDAEMAADVLDLKASYEARRNMTPTQALQEAVKKLLGASTRTQEKVVDTTPRVTEKDVSKEVAAERKKDAVKKVTEAVGKQPPAPGKAGLDSDKAGGALTAKDVMKLSQDDFSKLSDEMLARMRGDEI